MSRRRRIYEGKAKVLFEGPEPGTLVQYFKDDASAFNNQKRGIITQDVVVGHFSSNQGGWNAGGGIQHRFAGWNGDGKMRIFAEARYLDVLSPAVTTEPNGLGTTTVGEGTKIIPVTIGLRW